VCVRVRVRVVVSVPICLSVCPCVCLSVGCPQAELQEELKIMEDTITRRANQLKEMQRAHAEELQQLQDQLQDVRGGAVVLVLVLPWVVFPGCRSSAP
jgi:hypothetical protein